jgi:hypothetical protein
MALTTTRLAPGLYVTTDGQWRIQDARQQGDNPGTRPGWHLLRASPEVPGEWDYGNTYPTKIQALEAAAEWAATEPQPEPVPTVPTPPAHPERRTVEAHGMTFTLVVSQSVAIVGGSAYLEGHAVGVVTLDNPGRGWDGLTYLAPGEPGTTQTGEPFVIYPTLQEWAEHTMSVHAPDLDGPCGWACPTLHRAPYRWA